jgi:hypothetical protein
MNAMIWRWIAFTCLLPVSLSACSKPQQFRKPTIKVTGDVLVDGKEPDTPVQIECVNTAGMDKEHPTLSRSETNELGAFTFSTYQQGDGVPPGDYVLTFKWQQFNLMSRSYGGPDKLKGRYADPKKSEHKFSVKEGDEPLDLGTIKLTTK